MWAAAISPRGAFLPHQSQLVQLLEHCADVCRAKTHRGTRGSSRKPSRRIAGLRHRSAYSPAALAAAAQPSPQASRRRSRRRPAAPTSAGQATGLQPGQLLELECDSLAFGGQGVCKLAAGDQPPELAHLHGFVVFTRGALPGERLVACIQRVQKGHATAYKVRTVRASPDAAQPPCPHFGPCGGCQHQNLQYTAQLAEKQTQVSAALQRIAGVPDISDRVRPIVGAVEQYHYRNKLEFTFSGQTWVPAEDGVGGGTVPAAALGFVRPGHPSHVLPIDTCWLQDAAANEILAAVRDGTAEAQSQLELQGQEDAAAQILQRVAIRQGSCPDSGVQQHMVHLTTGAADAAAAVLFPVVAAIRERCPSVVSIVRTTRGGRPPAALGAPAEVLWGQPTISQDLAGLRFDISARSFFQTNSAQAAQLVHMVAQAAGLRTSDTVLDLFCGAGTFALALASQCADVHGFEVLGAAVANAQANAARNGISNAMFSQADLDRGMPAAAEGMAACPAPDVVITDPGRQGMSRRLLVWLAGCGVRRLVYVSCNPATMARDLAFLLGNAPDSIQPARFQLDYVQACDMFPQTSHVEVMAVLRCLPQP